MTRTPLLGVPPTVRALCLGTPPYAGSLPRDLYAALAYYYPPLVEGDDDRLFVFAGGSAALVELLHSMWKTASWALDGRPAAADQFVGRLTEGWSILVRLLDERRAVDIELDLVEFDGSGDAVIDLRDRGTTLLARVGVPQAIARMPAVLWRLARQRGVGRADLVAAAVGSELLEGRVRRTVDAETGLLDPVGQWREYGRTVLAQADADGQPTDRAAPPAPPSLRRLVEARAEASPPPGSAVLFPSSILEGVGRSDNVKELKRILKDVLDQPLTGVRVPADWDAWERALVARHPNGAAFIRAVRTSQGNREFWGHAVACADGPPGTGKSAMCRSIAEYSGLPFKRYQCDNASDNTYGGTPIRWTSAQADFVTDALAGFRTRTFAACLDEIEKASGSRSSTGGHMHDVLHGQWDRETAARWYSAFLAHEVDLTGVVFLCTSNAAASLPASLRDRMVVARVEEPTAEHLAALAPQVARDVCRDQGLDPAWGALDSTEWEALRQAWGAGGSIRRLQHLISTLLRARDADPSTPRH